MNLTETEKRIIRNLDLTESAYAALPRFSLQEMVDKTADQRRAIEANMDATHGAFDYDEVNLLSGLGAEDRARMAKSIVNTPLSRLMAAAYPESACPYGRKSSWLSQAQRASKAQPT